MIQKSETRSMCGVGLEVMLSKLVSRYEFGGAGGYCEWWRDVDLEGGRRLKWVEEEGLGVFAVTVTALTL